MAFLQLIDSALFTHSVKLKALHRFTSTATAVEDISAIQEGKLPKGLKKFLTDEIVEKGKAKETLAVIESKLGLLQSSCRKYCAINPYF